MITNDCKPLLRLCISIRIKSKAVDSHREGRDWSCVFIEWKAENHPSVIFGQVLAFPLAKFLCAYEDYGYALSRAKPNSFLNNYELIHHSFLFQTFKIQPSNTTTSSKIPTLRHQHNLTINFYLVRRSLYISVICVIFSA